MKFLSQNIHALFAVHARSTSVHRHVKHFSVILLYSVMCIMFACEYIVILSSKISSRDHIKFRLSNFKLLGSLECTLPMTTDDSGLYHLESHLGNRRLRTLYKRIFQTKDTYSVICDSLKRRKPLYNMPPCLEEEEGWVKSSCTYQVSSSVMSRHHLCEQHWNLLES